MDLETKLKKIVSEFDYEVDLSEYERSGNLIIVDAFWIPEEEAEKYIHDRELLAELVTEVFASEGYAVERSFQGSEDGEAILALDEKEDLQRVLHLDPYSVEDMNEVIKSGESLVDFIISNS